CVRAWRPRESPVPAHDERLAAAARVLGQPRYRLAHEFPVHPRHAPIALAAETLGDLPAVAEETQRIAKLEHLLAVQASVAGRAGSGQHALPNPVLQLLLQLAGGDGEQ